jgi:predicted porin
VKPKLTGAVVFMAFSGAAHAQSSVTLYGAIDSGLFYQSTSAATVSPTAKNLGKLYRFKDGGIYSSLWGIKGSEDLGGGYYVNFKLQGAFDSGTGKTGYSDTPGATALFDQISTVGVSGPFGTVSMGRQITPMAYAMADTDVRHAQFFGSVLTAWLGMNQAAGWPGTSTNTPIGSVYESNAIVYESPKFHGASALLEYAPGGVAGQFQGGTRESAVLNYSNYGLNLAAVYYNGHDTNPFGPAYPATPAIPATGQDNNRFLYFGAQYSIYGFSVSASYANGRNPAHSSQVDLDMYSAGLGYQFSPAFTVTGGVYYLKDKNDSANKSTEFAVGAAYSLSKATLLYAEVGHVNNEGNMTTPIAFGQPVAPGMATTAVMLGLRHAF